MYSQIIHAGPIHFQSGLSTSTTVILTVPAGEMWQITHVMGDGIASMSLYNSTSSIASLSIPVSGTGNEEILSNNGIPPLVFTAGEVVKLYFTTAGTMNIDIRGMKYGA